MRRVLGAGEKIDLEQFSSPELLGEMESWSDQITNNPFIASSIATIETKSDFAGDDEGQPPTPIRRSVRRQGLRP